MGKVLDRVKYNSWFVCYKTQTNNYIKISDCEFDNEIDAIIHAREIKELLKTRSFPCFRGNDSKYIIDNLVVAYKEVIKTVEISDFMGEIAI